MEMYVGLLLYRLCRGKLSEHKGVMRERAQTGIDPERKDRRFRAGEVMPSITTAQRMDCPGHELNSSTSSLAEH